MSQYFYLLFDRDTVREIILYYQLDLMKFVKIVKFSNTENFTTNFIHNVRTTFDVNRKYCLFIIKQNREFNIGN